MRKNNIFPKYTPEAARDILFNIGCHKSIYPPLRPAKAIVLNLCVKPAHFDSFKNIKKRKFIYSTFSVDIRARVSI